MTTRLLLMLGTVALSLLPLYLTAFRDAVYDGAFLVVSTAFAADALFRCLDPANRKNNRGLAFAVGAVIVLTVGLLQYGPIANDLRKEKLAFDASVSNHSVQLIADFERERDDDRKGLPNDSVVILLASILVEFSVIILVEGQP